MRIGQKLVCGFVSVALLVGVVGYVSVNTCQKTLQKTIGENSVTLAVETLDKIDRGIHNRIEVFCSYCKDLILQEATIKSNQEFQKLDNIQDYIDKKDKEWRAAGKEEITPFMQELINDRLSEELREKIEFYEEDHGYKVFGEIFVTNKYGANAAQTGKTTDYRQDDEEWWQRAEEDGLYIADVEYDRSAKVYSTDIGIRIDDENGNFSGVIKVVLNIEEVVNIIKEVEASAKYKTTQFKLLTKDGKLIYSTEDFEFFEDFSNELLSRFHKERPEEHLDYFIAEGDKPGEGDELFARAHSKGYKDYQGLGWILVIEHTTEEIFAPVAQLRNRLVIISLGVTVLAILMGFFISRAFSNPLMKLRDAAIEIGKGNLEARIEVKSNDEIGELASSFSNMSGKLKESHLELKESHKQLEVKVQQRTAELSSANEKLEEEIVGRSLIQKALEKRIKELNCLYGLSKLIEKQKIPLEQIFQEMPELIRKAYQYPDVTCARITFDGIQYKTDNFEKSEVSQYTQIKVRGDKAGAIEVYYLEEKPESGADPFLKEERDLLDALAERLGKITERKRAGEKLRLFRDLIERSNDCIFIIEPERGCFLDVNETSCGTLGYTREELLDMNIKDIDESVLDDSSWRECTKELKLKGDLVIQGQYKRKDGTIFFVETSLKLVSQENGERIIAIARDVTERMQAEEKLLQIQAAVDDATDAIMITDCDGKARYSNIAFGELFKHSSETINEAGIGSIFVDENVVKELSQTILGADSWKGEVQILSAKGRQFPALLRGTPITDEQSNVLGMLFIINDITELKEAEREQARLLEKVESANKELKDFAYIVSHDLKAPLRGVSTLANWISTDYADKLGEESKEQIDLLLTRVGRMHKLIDGVLQYSRVGRAKEEQIQVNLNELVEDVIDMVAPPGNIEITIEDELPVVECGQTRIIQVFQNLLSNAVKYMDKPQGRIKIGFVEEPGFWKFSVADNGPGIEEKHFERIFRIFQTLSPRDEFESTGVGLTVVKKIVELYGGRIWVESKLGEGSTFFFTLPKQKMGVKDAKLEANIIGRR